MAREPLPGACLASPRWGLCVRSIRSPACLRTTPSGLVMRPWLVARARPILTGFCLPVKFLRGVTPALAWPVAIALSGWLGSGRPRRDAVRLVRN